MKLPRFRRSFGRGDGPDRFLVRRAAAAKDEGRFAAAAALYEEALRLMPTRGDLHVQAGHMFKEARLYEEAGEHYGRAVALMPDDADLALQTGHFYKTVGRLGDASDAYGRAAALAPDWSEPRKELAIMRAAGWRVGGAAERAEEPDWPGRPGFDPRVASSYGKLAPERLPRPARSVLHRSEPSVVLRQFGKTANTFWGMKRIARGVEAIRGFCLATDRMLTVTALLDGLTLRHDPLKGPYELEYEPDPERIHKYVFNLWCDLSDFAPGLHILELRLHGAGGSLQILQEDFVIEAPLLARDHPASDAVVDVDPEDPRGIDEQINGRPSMVHEAARTPLLADVRAILVMRTDQLGDMVASIPALNRLRELFPQAKLVGLLGPANVDLARSLGAFDDIVVIDFRESMFLRTRTLDWDEQVQLRDRLAAFRFDLAIDLAPSTMSRPLLALSGAPFLYGFRDGDWPRLTASVDDACLDPKNGREITTHSARILAMIDRLSTLLAGGARVIRRDDLTRERLRAYGIADGRPYALLHTGARIVFSRWAHYVGLAERLHRDTDLTVVIFADRADLAKTMPPDLAGSERIVVIDRQLPFDDFDAMLSFCSVYVGNDSGPKHLAALRGAPVVSIHSARIDWREWGQEQTGVVITRKLPCAGCAIYHSPDECGKDFACVSAITLDDVYAAVRRYV